MTLPRTLRCENCALQTQIHLVDMYVVYRKQDGTQGLQDYERNVAKDVVALHPSSDVFVLVK